MLRSLLIPTILLAGFLVLAPEHTVRAQVVVPFAGGGAPESGIGDGGPATEAVFQHITAIAADSMGNVSVAAVAVACNAE